MPLAGIFISNTNILIPDWVISIKIVMACGLIKVHRYRFWFLVHGMLYLVNPARIPNDGLNLRSIFRVGHKCVCTPYVTAYIYTVLVPAEYSEYRVYTCM